MLVFSTCPWKSRTTKPRGGQICWHSHHIICLQFTHPASGLLKRCPRWLPPLWFRTGGRCTAGCSVRWHYICFCYRNAWTSYQRAAGDTRTRSDCWWTSLKKSASMTSMIYLIAMVSEQHRYWFDSRIFSCVLYGDYVQEAYNKLLNKWLQVGFTDWTNLDWFFWTTKILRNCTEFRTLIMGLITT